MARTKKDTKAKYQDRSHLVSERQSLPHFRRRFLNFKKGGYAVDGDNCPECGGLTDFRGSYLTCCECGWTEDILELYQHKKEAS
jgi:hypothetical protein